MFSKKFSKFTGKPLWWILFLISRQPATISKRDSHIDVFCEFYKTFKLACVFNIKLFFYGLILLIKSCKISYSNLDKALLFSRNQVFCLKNRKLWGGATTIEFNIFCWHFAHVLYFPMSAKACSRFLIDLDSELFVKVKKRPGFYTHYISINNLRSKQNKTMSNTFL